MTATTQAEQTALTLPQRAAVALGESANEAKLRELVAKSAGIVTVTNQDGREEAHRAGMVLLKTHTGIRATGKAARDDATKFSKAVIAMEDELIGIIEPEETRVLALRDSWDEKIAAEKAAKIAAERARVEAIQARIGNIAAIPASVLGMQSSYISDEFADLSDLQIDETFAEFREAAAAAKADALSKLDVMFNKAKELEAAAIAAEEARKAEAARIAAEREELSRLRAKAVVQEAEARRQREAAEAELRAERDRIAAEQAAEGKRLADRMAAEQAVLQAERERIAADQARAAAELRAAQERLEADRAAHEAKLQLERDHADALVMNADFDAAREAERVRLQALADQLLADNRLPLPESVTVRDAMIDDDVTLEVSDEEVIEAAIAAVVELGLAREWAIERLAAIDFAKAREAGE